MIRYFLIRVCVEGFRGVNNEGDPLEMKFNKDTANSVFAINGTGKSSVFDALCYAICGDVPKLAKLQAAEKPEEYYANKFHNLGEATILLELESDEAAPTKVTIQVHRAADGARTVTSPSGHADPEALLESLNESFTLLDHDTFSTFIDHTPLNRGRSFSSLLGLAVYSDFRQTLQSAIDTKALSGDLDLPALQAEVTRYKDASTTALGKLEVSYSALTGDSIADVTKLDNYTSKSVQALESIEIIKAEVTGKTLSEIDFEKIKGMIKAAEGGKDREELATVIASLTKLNGLGKPNAEVINPARDGFKADLAAIVELFKTTKGNLCKSLYSTADKLLKSGEWADDHECPLCGSTTIDPLTDTVAAQQQQYQEVDAKITTLQTAWPTNEWRSRIIALEDLVTAGLDDDEKKFRPYDQMIREGKISIDDFDELKIYYDKLETRYTAAVDKFTNRKDELEKKLPPSLVQLTEQVEHAKQYRDALKDYQDASIKFEAANTKLTDRKKWQTFITKAADVYAEAEANLSKNKIASIEAEYKDMFAKIMGVDDIKPDLQRDDQRENLQVQLSEFHGLHDVSARALLSESYRNALAISVYLTAAINHSGVPRFIVLDDITSSFDSGHQINLMEYIRNNLRYPDNAKGLQFIVLSHDGIMRKYFDGLQKADGWSHQTIEGNPPGLLTTRAQDANRIRTVAMGFLSAGQVDTALPFVRQYLEFTLMQIIRKVDIPVPLDFAIKDYNRMVANCVSAIKEAVDLHTKASTIILEQIQQTGFKNTYAPALISNWVSHYETGSGTSVSAPVMIGVLDSVDQLAECFKYDTTDVHGNPKRKWYQSLSSK
jgi:DNA repair exonuclease SbcCD ATPase subunit